MSENEPENDVYEGYSVDAEDQPQGDGSSTADDRGLTDPLDEGYSPPEKWSAAQGWGNTALEEELGESFDQRLAQEEPEPDPYVAAEQQADDLDDGEVGDERSGRLVAPDEGLGPDEDKDLVATDVGIDGAGASAEEAAIHEVDEDVDEPLDPDLDVLADGPPEDLPEDLPEDVAQDLAQELPGDAPAVPGAQPGQEADPA